MRGASTIARCPASARCRRRWAWGVLAPWEFTRFISSTTNTLRSGSIQMDVPVNPVWPNERGEKYMPALDPVAGVSQPSEGLDVADCRDVHRAIVAGDRMCTPL